MSQPGKAPGKNTPTWRLYESLFFLQDHQYPKFISGISRGQAINIAMGLNRCNVKYYQSLGAPDTAITLSAKAKQDQTGEWYVEVSKNYKRQGERSPARGGGQTHWMDQITAKVRAHEEGRGQPQARQQAYQATNEVDMGTPEPASVHTTPEADVQEEMLKKMYGL